MLNPLLSVIAICEQIVIDSKETTKSIVAVLIVARPKHRSNLPKNDVKIVQSTQNCPNLTKSGPKWPRGA